MLELRDCINTVGHALHWHMMRERRVLLMSGNGEWRYSHSRRVCEIVLVVRQELELMNAVVAHKRDIAARDRSSDNIAAAETRIQDHIILDNETVGALAVYRHKARKKLLTLAVRQSPHARSLVLESVGIKRNNKLLPRPDFYDAEVVKIVGCAHP